MGDINVDIKPNNGDRHSSDYLTLTASLGLLPAHFLPTRLDNCLDHIFLKTKSPAAVIILETFVTDHFPVILCLKTQQAHKQVSRRTFTRFNFPAIKKEIDSFAFDTILIQKDLNLATNSLVTVLQNAVSKNAIEYPVTRKSRLIKPWMTPGLARCIRNRDRMHLNVRNNPNNAIVKLTYTRYRNFCNILLRKLKHSYEKDELLKAKNDPKATWKVIKSITNTGRSPQSPNELLQESDDVSSLNEVNRFFANIGRTLASQIKPLKSYDGCQLSSTSPANSLLIVPVDEPSVERIIGDLRSDCAVGWDNIPAKVIKQSKFALTPVITHICNLAIGSGTFPDAFKKAVVHPIYKSGHKANVTNYRPISILSSLSKILEKILNNILISYLESYKIIAPNQYGFRKGVSTEDAVSAFTNSLVNKIDSRQKCYGIFLDLSKAFDTVSIPILLTQMERVGIRGHSLEIFRSYLTGRTQCVRIGSQVSDDEAVTFGVPQGSILGPTLFLIYINELCRSQISNCDIFTYADDTALLVYDDTWEGAKSKAECAIVRVMGWLSAKLLTLNLEKSKVIRFSLPNSVAPPTGSEIIKVHTCMRSAIDCNCAPLSTVLSIRYLGIHIDQRLDWKAHIETLCTRIRRLIYIFKQLRHSANSHALSLVYNALCHSIISYCIPVWGGTFKTALLRAERAQRAVLKVMSFKRRDFPTTQLYAESQVLTVRQTFIFQAILRHHRTLPYDESLLTRRHGHAVSRVRPCHTAFARRQTVSLSSKLYNKINNLVPLYSSNLYEIKIKLKKWLQGLTYSDTENLLLTVS